MLKASFKYNQILSSVENKEMEITKRIIPFNGGELAIIYIKQLTDSAMLSDNVVKPLMLYCSSKTKPLDAQITLDKILYAGDCKIFEEENTMDLILCGQAIIIFSTDTKFISVNLKSVEHRAISPPEIEYTLRGPKDCFVENFDANLSILRNRIKDEKLRIKTFEVGRRTKSRIAVLYIEDIVNDNLVNEIQKRIESIDVDGVYESGELQAFLLNKKTNLFPQMGVVERSDKAARLLLEGRAITLIEGSDLVISAPITFNEFFIAGDDFYDNKYLTILSRFLRYLSLIIAFTGTSLYVAITSFAYAVLPTDYLVMLAQMHSQIPYPAIVGAIALELLMEILREALLRIPQQIGTAVGIVGAIVIGQAAISAQIFSSILLIIASLSLICSFIIADYTLMNTFRLLKFFLLIFTGSFGFFGFSLFISILLVYIVSINSFGVPYATPAGPFKLKEFMKMFLQNRTINDTRPEFLGNKDKKLPTGLAGGSSFGL